VPGHTYRFYSIARDNVGHVEQAPPPDQPDAIVRVILKGDLNDDCNINILDLIRIRNVLGQDPTTGENWRADLSKDGRINLLDLILTRNGLGTRCE